MDLYIEINSTYTTIYFSYNSFIITSDDCNDNFDNMANGYYDVCRLEEFAVNKVV